MFAIFICALLRNYGQLSIYLFGLNSDPQEYLCRTSPDEPFTQCSNRYICHMRESNPDGIEYILDQDRVGALANWFHTRDYMCTPRNEVNSIVSYSFTGFAFGMALFFMPDHFGRKKSMNFLLLC